MQSFLYPDWMVFPYLFIAAASTVGKPLEARLSHHFLNERKKVILRLRVVHLLEENYRLHDLYTHFLLKSPQPFQIFHHHQSLLKIGELSSALYLLQCND